MVSLWPFGSRDSSSAASFEKTLSQLSEKINRYSSQVDSFRSKQRRFKALWTLYSAFAYILVAAILTLVTGWDKWGPVEYTSVAGGPVAIVAVRWLLTSWYDYRIENVQTRMQGATKEREKVIEKLKIATKYDSTQQLLDKYGGGSGGASKEQQQQRSKSPKRKTSGRQSLPAHFQPQQQQGPRTGFAPPPTANIAGRQPPPQNALDARLRSATQGPVPQQQQQQQQQQQPPSESFAPNAFPSHLPPQQPPQYAPAQPAWYDRIMDVVLGEDETQAKNRFALICGQCRLVNGQAPPGARSLEDVGRWRCKECGATNGVESEAGRVLQEAQRKGVSLGGPVDARVGAAEQRASEAEVKREDDVERESEGGEESAEGEDAPDQGAGLDTPPAASTRSKARQRKKA